MRHLVPVFLISASIISFQLVLIQIISITQWYHFAYMIISIALLGFGAAGTTLSLYKHWFLKHASYVIYFLVLGSGFGFLMAVPLSQWEIIRFDSYLLFTEISELTRLLTTYLIFFLPFYFGALALGIFFFKYAERIGSIYFANLSGSALGGVVVPVVMWWIAPNALPLLVGALSLITAVLVVPGNHIKWYLPIAAGGGLITLLLVYPSDLHISQFKSLSSVLELPKSQTLYEGNSPYGQLNVVASPALRDGHGVSLQYRGEIPVQKAIFNNGNWVDAVLPWKETDSSTLLDFVPKAFAYRLLDPKEVLLLQGGAFNDVSMAEQYKAENIIAIEPNPQISKLMSTVLVEEKRALFSKDNVKIINTEPRTFLLSSHQTFDLISLPDLGSFGGSSGLNAIDEDYLFTKEAFDGIWEKLDSNGIMEVTVWIDFPLRQALKLCATIRESLDNQDIKEPDKHVVAIKTWGTISFFLKKSAFNNSEIEDLEAFCDTLGFEPVLLNEEVPDPEIMYSKDTVTNEQLLKAVFSDNAKKFYEEYAFRIKPATDQKPFFNQFLKWDSLQSLNRSFNSQSLPFFEIGYLMVWITFIQIFVIAVLLIIIPLLLKKSGSNPHLSWWLLVYFGCIGLGYMFIEIFLLQKSILYFGNPVYAAAAAISIMLLFAGFGSYYSEQKHISIQQIKYVFLVIAIMIGLYILFFNTLLKSTIQYDLPVKIVVFSLCLIPLSFLLGLPFPTAIKYLSKHHESSIPWAWGINGFFSVISTVLATIISIELGFNWVLGLAALVYFIPMIIIKYLD